MSRLNVNSVNAHSGVNVNVTGSTNGGLIVSASPASDGNPVVQVHGSVSASGEITASNAFFSGDVHTVGNIYVEGHATFSAYTSGGIQLGDHNTDNVTFGADVNSHIIPDANNTYDLGSDAQEWKDVYVEGTGYIDRIVQDDVSVTNTFEGNSDFHSNTLYVDAGADNVGVKTADPNQEFEVKGRITCSQQLSVGGAGDSVGHITGSGNLVVSGTAEFLGGITTTHLTASGNISASGTIYAQTFMANPDSVQGISITGNITQSANISSSGIIYAEHLYSSDDAEITDDLTIGGRISNVDTTNITASNQITASSLTATHSFGGRIVLGGEAAPEGKLEILNPDTENTPAIKLTNNNVSNWALRGEGARLGANISVLRSNVADYVLRIGDSATNGILEVMGGGAGIKLAHNVTSSGNISSSGTITAANFTAAGYGNISAANITASGQISGSSLTATHSYGGRIVLGGEAAPEGKLEVLNPDTEGTPALKLTNNHVSNWALRGEGARLGANISVLRSNVADYVLRIGDSATNGILEVMGGGAGIIAAHNVTASAGVSASGTVYGNAFEWPATGSGNICATTTAASADATSYSVNGNRVEVRNQTQGTVADGAFIKLELRNTSIATNSMVIGTFTGGTSGCITGSIITAATTAAGTASVQIHNETGITIADDTGFTASFAII